jgi:hypothetical protein
VAISCSSFASRASMALSSAIALIAVRIVSAMAIVRMAKGNHDPIYLVKYIDDVSAQRSIFRSVFHDSRVVATLSFSMRR